MTEQGRAAQEPIGYGDDRPIDAATWEAVADAIRYMRPEVDDLRYPVMALANSAINAIRNLPAEERAKVIGMRPHRPGSGDGRLWEMDS